MIAGASRQPSRRAGILALALALLATPLLAGSQSHAAAGISPEGAFERLMDGNARFASGRPRHPREGRARRQELATTQHPSAVIVGCSDSRVAPELVFDQGLGDVFVVRTAGNRLDDLVLASIEYAVEHLGSTLVVVLGHERCGAVSAAVEAAHPGHGHEPAGSHVPVLVGMLQDAVSATSGRPGDAVENAVVENVRIVVADLPTKSPPLAARVAAGGLSIVGARYDLDTGEVTRLAPETIPADPASRESRPTTTTKPEIAR
jgi:carbonic anhydrase